MAKLLVCDVCLADGKIVAAKYKSSIKKGYSTSAKMDTCVTHANDKTNKRTVEGIEKTSNAAVMKASEMGYITR